MKKCDKCDGMGWLMMPNDSVTCDKCGGAGEVKTTLEVKKSPKVMKPIEAEFWVHCHHKEIEPVQWDILNVKGEVNVSWLLGLFESQDTTSSEDLEMLWREVGELDKAVWLVIEPCQDDYGRPWFYVSGRVE